MNRCFYCKLLETLLVDQKNSDFNLRRMLLNAVILQLIVERKGCIADRDQQYFRMYAYCYINMVSGVSNKDFNVVD